MTEYKLTKTKKVVFADFCEITNGNMFIGLDQQLYIKVEHFFCCGKSYNAICLEPKDRGTPMWFDREAKIEVVRKTEIEVTI